MTMPLARRLALLDWASASGGFVIEDDYDSEFRYAGRPIAPLAGLDRGGRVVYLGSFTKVMFRALRLGYLVAPDRAVDGLLAVQREFGGHSSMVAQPALAEFVASGAFAAHIRRMRRLYAARQQTLIGALSRRLGGLLHVEPQDYGMHLVATFAGPLEGRDDVAVARRCMEGGIDVSPLSTLYRAAPPVNGLLLGYAGWGKGRWRRRRRLLLKSSSRSRRIDEIFDQAVPRPLTLPTLRVGSLPFPQGERVGIWRRNHAPLSLREREGPAKREGEGS